MKKLFFAVLVTLIGLAFTAPAFAIEHQFGGYWRVRMYTQKNFTGSDDGAVSATAKTNWAGEATDAYSLKIDDTGVLSSTLDTSKRQDLTRADTRTRLYYTAVINDNLKFVNKFEMNAVWGAGSYGEIGADGDAFVVKNTYAEFTTGGGLFRVGTQGAVISRGFVFDDDFSGLVAVVGPATMLYAKVDESDDNTGADAAIYHVNGAFDLGAVKLTPGLTYVDLADSDEAYVLALDVDHEMFWATLLYEGGEYKDIDISAWLVAVGGSVSVSDMLSVHGQAFYATGDDDGTADGDLDAFTMVAGQSYYWSEIMGLGIFDSQVSNGSCGGSISNIMAINMGVTATPMDKLTVSADLWYATLAEDDANNDKDLGIEFDVKATYQIVEGLSLDVVGAYLFADDATEADADDANPWEVGTRFSLSF